MANSYDRMSMRRYLLKMRLCFLLMLMFIRGLMVDTSLEFFKIEFLVVRHTVSLRLKIDPHVLSWK